MKTYDAKGLLCPGPLILAKKGLKETPLGEEYEIVIDNETSYKNVISFLKDNFAPYSEKKEGEVYTLMVKRKTKDLSKENTDEYCHITNSETKSVMEFEHISKEAAQSEQPSEKSDEKISAEGSTSRVSKKNYVISVTSPYIAKDDELGNKLTSGFFSTIKELEPPPSALILYHEAVKLCKEDSPVLHYIRELEKIGIKVLLCGTCTDFYGISDKVKAGKISNAYDILQTFTDADKIIKL